MQDRASIVFEAIASICLLSAAAETLAFFLGGMVDEPSSEVEGSATRSLLTRR